MKKIQDEIKNRLVFDGVIDSSFELNANFFREIDYVSNDRKKFVILTGPDINLGFQDVDEMIAIIYVGNDCGCEIKSEDILNEINVKYSNIENSPKYLDIKKNNEAFNIRLYFIFNKLGTRYNFESSYDIQRCFYLSNIRSKLKFISDIKNFKSRNFIVTYDYISLKQDDLNYKPKISVKSRVLINSFESISSRLYGYIFTAKLRDLVSIFEVKSNNLFKDNVRYGISENNSVDLNITETLKENPSDFWYLNNGITIFTESTIDIKSSQYLKFENNNFSVVNGAQTITSAAKFFFSTKDIEKVKNAEENAYVILKVIEGEKSLVNNITVSLNRQKPIYIEDIEFFSNGISNLNLFTGDTHIQIENDLRFQIVRKGEAVSPYNKCYGLPSIARMITAIKFENPGFARSGSLTQILKQNKLFPEEVTYEVFNEYYWYINYAMRIQADYLDYVKRVNFLESEDIASEIKNELNAVLLYGQYHIITAFVKAFLICDSEENKSIISSLDDDLFKKLIFITHDYWSVQYENQKSIRNIWDSNMFKNTSDSSSMIKVLSNKFKEEIDFKKVTFL